MKLTSTSRMISSEIAANPANAKDSRCLNISNMVLAALPTIAFGVFTIIFTMQQNRAANENRKQDQQQADEQSIRVTFENYINDISELLLDLNFNRSNTEHLLHIRVKTMTVLRYVDANRKRDIVLFLYESRLLRSDMPASERLNLIGADLGGLQFIGSSAAPIQLDHLYLPGVYAPNAVFHWCQLDYAVFDNASMPHVTIINSTMSYATFRRIHAPDLTIGDASFHQNNFTGATVVRLHFVGGAAWKEGIDFSNADLLDSRTSDQQILDLKILPRHLVVFQNTRFPDGSFFQVDSSELVIDGGAEHGVCENIVKLLSFRCYLKTFFRIYPECLEKSKEIRGWQRE